MEVLKDYPQEFAKMFRASFSFLFKINLKFWFNDEGWLTRNWRFLYVIPCIAIFSIFLSIDVYKLMMKGDIFEIAYRLPPFLVMTQAVLKVVILFSNSTQITYIIKELGAMWRTKGLNDKQLSDRHTLLKRVNLCNTGTYWVSIIGSSQYLLSPLFETLFYKFILKRNSELLLPIIANSYPFDPTDNFLVYIAVYAFQTYSMFLCVLAYIGAEMIMITLCSILGMEFMMLSEDMEHVKPVNKKPGGYSIQEFVKKHQKLITLSSLMDNAFNKVIFVDILFVGGTTCFFRYSGQFSRGPTYMVNNYLAVVTSLCYVLYLCYYGEFLTESSIRVGKAAYENLWYEGDKHYQRTIFMIIKRSQNACCLTSMKYAPITLNMFTKVMSTTWSYISLMNTVYGE